MRQSMVSDLVVQALLGVLVVGGLAFGDRIVDRLMSLNSDPESESVDIDYPK